MIDIDETFVTPERTEGFARVVALRLGGRARAASVARVVALRLGGRARAASVAQVVTLLVAALVPALASAAIHVVQPDGLGDFPTVQAAIDAAAAGDTLELTSGTFLGVGNRDLSFAGKSLLVRSASGDPDSTILDCEALGRVASFGVGDTALVFTGIAFHGGRVLGSERGGALAIGTGARPWFENCVFAGHQADAEGGAVHLTGANATFVDCLFTGNAAADGGAFYAADSSAVTLLGCTLADNVALVRGGGIHAAADSLFSAERTVLWGNCAGTEGGALFAAANAVVDFACSDVDSAGVDGAGSVVYDSESFFANPRFCAPAGCVAPTTAGDYTVRADSPVLPGNAPCAALVGARDVGCAVPTGACCAADGSCTVVTSADCTTAGGSYQGDATGCDPNPCPQPTGACCAADGSCTVVTSADCTTAGGSYQGDATGCDPNPCPQPTGACCASDGTCTLDTPLPCAAGGGVFQGPDTVCDPNPCPAFTVAPDGSGDFATIQAAIDAVASTANIELTSGVFTGVGNRDLVFRGKALTLRSASGDPDSTIIDCQSLGRGFYFKDGEDATTVVRGIGILHGAVIGSGRGGGIAMIASSPQLIDCAVRGSTSQAKGGGVYLLDASPVLATCLLAGNQANLGGGLFVEGNSRPRLVATTIAGNEALGYGGGIYTATNDSLLFERSILWGNCAALGGEEARLEATGAILASTCSLADSAGVEGNGTADWSADDLFVNPRFCAPADCATAPTTAGDYTVRAGSPVLSGESPCGPQVGALGEGCPSFALGACCLLTGGCALREEVVCTEEGGAYGGDGSSCDPDPCPAGGVCCLDNGGCLLRVPTACTTLGGSYLGDGTSCSPEACALTVLPDGSGDHATIQAAVDAATSGAIVELGDGVFTGPGNRGVQLRGKSITVRSASGNPEVCLVDAQGLDRGFYFRDGEGAGTVVEGIGIRNGTVTGSGRGGGIACVLESSPTLRNLSIRGCSSEAEGGGFYASSGAPILEGCLIAGNLAEEGAGLHLESSASAVLRGCTISGNRALVQGGGVHAAANGAAFEETIVWGNCATQGAEVWVAAAGIGVDFTCSSVDSAGVEGVGPIFYDATTLFGDPLFCDYDSCLAAPTLGGDYSLSADSPCLPTASPCAERIGARGLGCGGLPTGACCLPEGGCAITSEVICGNGGGSYAGDGVPCDPTPCAAPGACCLPDGGCDLLAEFACDALAGGFRGAGTVCEADSCPALVVLADGSGPFATIQEAIDFAGSGATIELGDGDFRGVGNKDLRFHGKELILRSASGNPDSCRIDCEGNGRGLYFRDGEGPGTVVEAIGIVGGAAVGNARGAGIAIVDASPTLRRLLVSGCAGEASGGGLYVTGGEPSLENCTIARNRAARGGGIFVEGDGDLTLTRTIVHGNCATELLPFGNQEDEAVVATEGSALRFVCAAVDSAGVSGSGTIVYDADTIYDAPIFCSALSCEDAPSAGGVYRIDAASPCAPGESPCGALIGALEVGCAGEVGACCLDYLCFVTNEPSCVAEDGIYQGSGTDCDPTPCAVRGACCLPDDTCVFVSRDVCFANGGSFLGEDIPCSPDGCSFNAGGVLLLHAAPELRYVAETAYCDSASLGSCPEVVNSVAAVDTLLFHVIAALPEGGDSRVAGVTFGIGYDPAVVTILDSGACGDFELAEPAWPDSGSGTAVTWTTAQLDLLLPVYWFAVVVPSGVPTEIRLLPHPSQGAFLADDQVPPQLDQIACLGTLGIELPGNDCCATVEVVTELPVPREFQLHAPRPNPTQAATEIRFDLPEAREVDLAVFDATGRKVAQLLRGMEPAGAHRVVWAPAAGGDAGGAGGSSIGRRSSGGQRGDGRHGVRGGVGNGVYFVRLVAGGETLVRKVVVIE